MDLDVETGLGGGEKTAFQRWLAVLVGVAAVAAALIATLEADADRREEHAFVRGSRLSLDIFEGIAGAGPRTSLQARGLEQALSLNVEATARVAGSGPELFDLQAARAAAESKASDRLIQIVERMTALPGPDSEVDPHTREILAADPVTLTEVVLEQNAQVDAAERFGTRQDRAIFALSLVAITAVLLGLAGVMGEGRPGRVALIVAAISLAAALGWGAAALPL